MEANQHFSIQHRKFKKSALQLTISTLFVLLVPNANAVEVIKDSETAEGSGTAKESGSVKESGAAKESGFSSETGVITEPGFTREPGFSKEAGVTKKILISTGVDYDSNPALSERNKEPVWIYSIAPQFLLNVNSELNSWFFDAALLVQRHSNEKVLFDREDPRLALGWERTYESGLFGVKADYLESSSRISELRSTGAFSSVDNTQKTKMLTANWRHVFSPRWSIDNVGAYTDVKYTAAGVLGDYNLSQIRSKLTYANTEKLDTYAELGYLYYNPDKVLDDTDFFRLMLGADYQLKEGLNIGVRGGAYHISGQQSDSGLEAGVYANYTVERMNYSAELSRSLGAGGIGGFQKIDSLRLGWAFDISEIDRVGADYGLSKSKKDASINVEDVDNQQISAFYERTLSSHWQARISAAYRENETPDTQSQGSLIGVTLMYDTLSF